MFQSCEVHVSGHGYVLFHEESAGMRWISGSVITFQVRAWLIALKNTACDMPFIFSGPNSVFISGSALLSMRLDGQEVHTAITYARSWEDPTTWDDFGNFLVLKGILFIGDVEQGGVCTIFPFAKAGSGNPLITSPVGYCVVRVPVELPGIKNNEAIAATGGTWSGARPHI